MDPPVGPPEEPSCTREASMLGSCPLRVAGLGCLPGHCAFKGSGPGI